MLASCEMPQLILFLCCCFFITYGYHSFLYGKYEYECVLQGAEEQDSWVIGKEENNFLGSKVKGHRNLLSHKLILP